MRCADASRAGPAIIARLDTAIGRRPARQNYARLYVLSLKRRLTLDSYGEGYPDGPGRASNKEGES